MTPAKKLFVLAELPFGSMRMLAGLGLELVILPEPLSDPTVTLPLLLQPSRSSSPFGSIKAPCRARFRRRLASDRLFSMSVPPW